MQKLTMALRAILFLAFAVPSFAEQVARPPDNYYSLEMEGEAAQRFMTRLQANIMVASEPRLDRIVEHLVPKASQFHYRIFVFEGGAPSPDTAPAAAFPADWRRLELDEAIAVAGGTIFVPRRLLSRDDTQLSAILAHAIGHIALRHATLGMTRGELAQVEVQAASRSMPDEAPQRVRAVALKRFAFDRACEIAADGYAAKLLHDVGLDPAGLLRYLQALPSPENEEFAVYPSPAERVQNIQTTIASFKQ